MTSSSTSSIGGHIVRGSVWMVARGWVMRGIGLLNTIVLARILTPDDFGIMAMSVLVVEILMMLADTNVDISLIREQNASRHIYDSAWTVQALCGLAVAGLVVLLVPLVLSYYRDPRVATVMYILALRPAILGLENVGVVEFRKSLDFAKEFRYWVYPRLLLLIVNLVLALTFRNYFALAVSVPLSAAVTVAFSYAMSSYRPRPSLAHARVVWRASRWMITQSLAQEVLERTDQFVIGGMANPTAVGNYYIANEVAPMPTKELAWPIERALMPTYAKIVTTPDELRRTVVAVMGVVGTICISAGIGVAVVAENFVLTVFGDAWRGSIPFFSWLAIFGIFSGLGRPLMPLFYNLKRERLYATLTVIQATVSIPVLFITAYSMGLVAIAATRTLIASVFFLILCVVATRVSSVRAVDFVRVLWRPTLAALFMAIGVLSLRSHSLEWPILSLLRDCLTGAILFACATGALWFVVGRPDGPERLIIDWTAARIRR